MPPITAASPAFSAHLFAQNATEMKFSPERSSCGLTLTPWHPATETCNVDSYGAMASYRAVNQLVSQRTELHLIRCHDKIFTLIHDWATMFISSVCPLLLVFISIVQKSGVRQNSSLVQGISNCK